jgi:hypothetical protein
MLIRSLAALFAVTSVASAAVAQTSYDVSAPSTVHIEKKSDGIEMRVRNARFVPYRVWKGDKQELRLATINYDVRTSTTAEGTDPASTIAITIEDLSGATAKRLASYTDPGALADILGDYSVATFPGCCGGADIHRVRYMENGRALFRSTGPMPMGSAAWAEAPNAKPRTVRWAALDCDTDEKDIATRFIGRLLYGGDAGKLSSIDIVLKGQSEYDETWLPLAHDAIVQWLDAKADPATDGPSSGTAEAPKSIWALDGVSDPAKLTGFKVIVTVDGKEMMSVPVVADRLDIGKASVAEGLLLSASP